ncbi:MAG: hypothetical protein ACOY3J_12935, partial [Bacillota bacterium]
KVGLHSFFISITHIARVMVENTIQSDYGGFPKKSSLFCRKLGAFLKYYWSYHFLFISTNCITPVLI